MNEYVNDIQPDIGGVWHADEMMVKIDGSWEYLWNVMDEQTRFQLASVVSTERKVRDARQDNREGLPSGLDITTAIEKMTAQDYFFIS